MTVSSHCSGGSHRTCPGFYKSVFTCQCICHSAPKERPMTIFDKLTDLNDRIHQIATVDLPDYLDAHPSDSELFSLYICLDAIDGIARTALRSMVHERLGGFQ